MVIEAKTIPTSFEGELSFFVREEEFVKMKTYLEKKFFMRSEPVEGGYDLKLRSKENAEM